MLSHLHLHLEPEQRKRILLGLTSQQYQSREQFFDAHQPHRNDRLAVGGADLQAFLIQVHAEQRMHRIDYVELRLSPRRFIAGGMTWIEFLRLSSSLLASFSEPEIRGILLLNRDSPPSLIAECREMVEQGLPPSYVGIDLAGDELRFPDTEPFRSLFQTARRRAVGITVHAGEFGGADSVWRALDDLGAVRIGHGLAAATSNSLMKRLAQDNILIETSIGSNLALGAISSLSLHPARLFVEQAIPVCFNADVPLHTGRSFTDEVTLAAELLKCRYQDVLALQAQATPFTFENRSAKP